MIVRLFFRLFLIVLITFNISPVLAHVPHDVVGSLVASPNESTEVYSIVRGNVVKSTDKGLTWRRMVQGLDNKYSLQSIIIDPNYPRTLYVSTLGDGIYKSDDKAHSWYKVNQGLTNLSFNKLNIPKSKNAQAVYAASTQGGLYKLTNNTWTKIYDKSARISAIASLNSENMQSYSLLIADKTGALLSSINGDTAWQKLYQLSNCGDINSIATSPNPLSANTFLLGTSLCGILRTTDGGHSFTAANSGILDLNIRSIAILASSDNIVFASTYSQAIFISTDSGLTWQKNSNEIEISEAGKTQANDAKLPLFADIAISADFQNDKTLFLGSFDGLFRSINSGDSWQQMNTLPLSLIQGLAISPAYALDSTLALTTYDNGIYQSNNRGKIWQRIAKNIENRNYDIAFSPNLFVDKTLFVSNNSNSLNNDQISKSTDGGLTWTSYNLPALHTGPTIIAISPSFANDATLFLGSRHGLIYRSTDGGKSSKIIFNELHSSCDGCISSIILSPDYANDKTIIIASSTGIHFSKDTGNSWVNKVPPDRFGLVKITDIKLVISPNYVLDHHIFIATPNGLFITSDEFNSVQKISGNSIDANSNISQIAISPDYKNDSTLIFTIKGKGLFKTIDNGLSFQPINPKLIGTNHNFEFWDGFPAASSSIIVFSPNYAVDKTIFAGDSTQVFRSQDAGKTWQAFNFAK